MPGDSTVSSPTSTSGAGYTYEHQVGAWFLSMLLIRGIPVVFKDCQVDEVSFQTRHLGWKTDDFLVSCLSGVGVKHRLAVQARRTFTVSASNTECRETIEGFWEDFKSSDWEAKAASARFDPEGDALLLVTLRGTESLLIGLGGLLDCARNSSDVTDFVTRLGLTGYLSKKSKRYSEVIRSIVDGIESGSPVSDEEFWHFLKVIYIMPIDFTTSTALQETVVKSALAMASTADSQIDAAGTDMG